MGVTLADLVNLMPLLLAMIGSSPGFSFKHPSRPRVFSALTNQRENLAVFGTKESQTLHDTMDSEEYARVGLLQ